MVSTLAWCFLRFPYAPLTTSLTEHISEHLSMQLSPPAIRWRLLPGLLNCHTCRLFPFRAASQWFGSKACWQLHREAMLGKHLIRSGCTLLLMQLMNCKWGDLSTKWPVSPRRQSVIISWVQNEELCLEMLTQALIFLLAGEKNSIWGVPLKQKDQVLHRSYFFSPLIFMLMYLGKSHHPQHPVSSNAESPFGFWCIMESCSKAREAKNVICFSPAEPLQAFLLYLKIASRAQEHFFIFFCSLDGWNLTTVPWFVLLLMLLTTFPGLEQPLNAKSREKKLLSCFDDGSKQLILKNMGFFLAWLGLLACQTKELPGRHFPLTWWVCILFPRFVV